MQLNDEQLETIETFGSLNYPPEKIVMILNIDHDDFFIDFNMPDSDPAYAPGQIRYHYDRGQLMAQAEIDKSNLKRAKEGNLTSIAQYKKDIIYRDTQNAKKRTIFHQEETYLQELKLLIENGQTTNLTPLQVQFIEQIDFIRSLHLRWNSKPFIINSVRMKWPDLSRNQVGKLYDDAVNFFYLDNDIKMDAWKNVYAEKLDNLSALALEMNDLEQCRRCIAEAADIRGVKKENAQQIPQELLDRRPVYYTLDIEQLGIPKVNRYELAAFIDNLELTSKEKHKIKREAMLEDTPFELITDDETD